MQWNSNYEWQRYQRLQLFEGSVGSKALWSITKKQWKCSLDSSSPPPNKLDDSVATSSRVETEFLGTYPAGKMQTPDLSRSPSTLTTNPHLQTRTITREAEKLQLDVDVSKTLRPYDISCNILKRCAEQLATTLAFLSQRCGEQQKWQQTWEPAREAAVH